MDSSHISSKSYIRFIAILQVLTIIMVVFGHSLYFYQDMANRQDLLVNKMMYSFRMPTFMFVSGYLLMTTTYMRGKIVHPQHFLHTKFTRLLIPFILLTAAVYVPRSLMSYIANNSVNLDIHSFFAAFLRSDAMPIPYYWFIHSSFTLLIVTYMTLYFAWRHGVGMTHVIVGMMLVMATLSIFGPDLGDILSLQRTVSMALYFLAGTLCAYCGNSVIRFIDKNTVVCLIIFGSLWAIGYFYLFNTPFRSICSLLGVGMCLSFAMKLSHCKWTVFDHLIGANYIIFLLSWFFNVLSQQVLAHFVELPLYVYSILSFVTGIYVPFLFYRWLIRHRDNHVASVMAFCLGQNIHRSTR